MPKSIWRGEISFGLVSIPVSLYSVEEQNEIQFHLLDKKTKSRVHYQRISEKMAITLINEMTTKWQPEKYHNEYREALRKWLDQQIAKQPKIKKEISQSTKKSSADVVDFIALLKESMKKRKSIKNTDNKKNISKKE